MKNVALIFLGICILIAGGFIGSGLNSVANSINQHIKSDDSYRVVVQDGTIYMYDTIIGQVWKKTDKPDSRWEEIDGLFDD